VLLIEDVTPEVAVSPNILFRLSKLSDIAFILGVKEAFSCYCFCFGFERC